MVNRGGAAATTPGAGIPAAATRRPSCPSHEKGDRHLQIRTDRVCGGVGTPRPRRAGSLLGDIGDLLSLLDGRNVYRLASAGSRSAPHTLGSMQGELPRTERQPRSNRWLITVLAFAGVLTLVWIGFLVWAAVEAASWMIGI